MKLKSFTKTFGCEVLNFAHFGRAIYKGTSCGPWLVAILPDGEKVYYEDGKASQILPETNLKAIKVGSIVEGWDGELESITVINPANLPKAIESINEQASQIWEEANPELEVSNAY